VIFVFTILDQIFCILKNLLDVFWGSLVSRYLTFIFYLLLTIFNSLLKRLNILFYKMVFVRKYFRRLFIFHNLLFILKMTIFELLVKYLRQFVRIFRILLILGWNIAFVLIFVWSLHEIIIFLFNTIAFSQFIKIIFA
jgi:hypothetical protein